MNAPLLSIITPIYNIETRLINRLLESIYCNSIDHSIFEVMLIDDGSDSPVIISELTHNNQPNLRLFRQENRGLGAARNIAIPLTSGKYIYFVDADDYLFSENLPTLIDILNENCPEIAIVDWKIVHSKQREQLLQTESHAKLYATGVEYGKKNHWKGGIARYIFLRKLIETNQIAFPEGVWHEDELFITKALFFCKNTLETKLTAYAYYQRHNSITQQKSPEAKLKRINDRFTALAQLDSWISSFSSIDTQQKEALSKKKEFLIVDCLLLLCKESIGFNEFSKNYRRLLQEKHLPLPSRRYGVKYAIFRIASRFSKLLFTLSPIIKKII